MPVSGQDRDVVELGVVQAVQEMDGAWPRCGQAHAEPTGRLGITGGHEGGGLLVMDEDEADPVLVASEPFHDAVDAVAGQAEDGVDTPVRQSLDEHLRRNCGHVASDSAPRDEKSSVFCYPRRAPGNHQAGGSFHLCISG